MGSPSNPAGSPARLTAFIVSAWVIFVVGTFLLRYDAWIFPVHAGQLCAGLLGQLWIGPQFGAFALRRLGDLACLIAILAAAFGAGAWLLAWFTSRRDGLTALYAVGIGLWVVAVATLALGMVSVHAVPLAFGLGIGWFSRAARAWLGQLRWPTGRLTGWEWALLAALVVALALNLPGMVAPPFEYDELEYHLGGPAEYLREGRIVFLPHNFYTNLPQLTEMLFLLALKTSSDVAAKLAHGMFGWLTVAALYLLGTRLWSRAAGLGAAALFCCLPHVQDLSQTARIDLATTFYATLAFGAVLLWRLREDAPVATQPAPRPAIGWLYLAGLAAGMAVATKWTAIPVVLLPATVFVVATSRSVWPGLKLLALAGLCVAPWLAKNLWLAGNPVYPLFHEWLPSPHWSGWQVELFARKHYPSFDAAGWWQFLERAWHYSFVEPGAAPLLFLAAPLAFLKRGRAVGWLAVLFALAYAGWFLGTFRPWRFLLPALPLLALLGGAALTLRWRAPRIGVGIVLATAISLLALRTLVDVEDPARTPPRVSFVQHALGQSSREEFIGRLGGGVYEPVLWMNEHLPADAAVLYVGEARTHYARHNPVYATAFDQHLLEILESPTDLRAVGVTHVFIQFPELRRLSLGYDYLVELDWAAFRGLLTNSAREIYRTERAVVYEWNP